MTTWTSVFRRGDPQRRSSRPLLRRSCDLPALGARRVSQGRVDRQLHSEERSSLGVTQRRGDQTRATALTALFRG